MMDFMDYVEQSFYRATKWNEDNLYRNLNATARAVLDFKTPKGLRMNLSSLSSPNFATSYGMASFNTVDGSVSYLYSSRALDNVRNSGEVEFKDAIFGYRDFKEIAKPDASRDWEIWQGGVRVDRKDSLLYGRMNLPKSDLLARYVRRLAPTRQLNISVISDSSLPNGGTITTYFQQDNGKFSSEYLYSTDVALIGISGLYNFGFDPRKGLPGAAAIGAADPRRLTGRFSAGAEAYYGVFNKIVAASTAIRYMTSPSNTSSPLTMTLTFNPIVTEFQAAYAVKVGKGAVFCSRYDFNVSSYGSNLELGFEIWKRKQQQQAAKTETGIEEVWQPDGLAIGGEREEDVTGVLKARIKQNLKARLLWEGRFKQLLFSIGSIIELKRRDRPFMTVGIEIQYNS